MYIEARVIDIVDTGNTFYTRRFRDCGEAERFARMNTTSEQEVRFKLVIED